MRTSFARIAVLAHAVVAAALVVAACGGADPTATPRPTATATPQPQATATPVPTPEPTVDPRQGGTIRMGKPCAIKDLEPLYASTCMQNISWPMYDSLISRGATEETLEEFEPGLASSWDIAEGGTRITLELVEGATWHDGQPFTAADAEYSFDAVFNPPEGSASQYKARISDVESVTAAADGTIVITTKRPTAAIIEAISIVRMAPKHAHATQRPFTTMAVGTGPFMLDDLAADESSVREVKNPDYWRDGEPFLDAVEFIFLSDHALQLAALRAQRIDAWMSDFAKGQIPVIKSEQRINLRVFPKLQYATLWFKLGEGHPWDDLRVRQAMSLAIDRPAHLQAAWLETDEIGQFALPGAWALPASEVQTYPGWGPDFAANLAQAKELMQEAGYADGFSAELKFPESGNWAPSSATLQQMMREINIDITLRGLEVAAASAARRSGEFELLNWPNVPALSDPNDILFVFTSTNTYVGHGYGNAMVDEMFDRALGTFDVGERKQLINDIERELFREMPALPTVSRSGTMGSWDYVMGFAPHGLWYHGGTWQFRTIWIDQSKK